MSYKIFLSYYEQERPLAEFVKNMLTRIFNDHVEVFYDVIRGGDNWKKVIQNGLEDSDAILTILTPKYLQRPWAYIEWSAFWLKDRTRFLLLTDDVEVKDIIEPMLERQSTRMFSKDDVEKLLHTIKRESGYDAYTDIDIVSEFSNTLKAIYEKLLSDEERQKYSIYKNASGLLPNDDFKKVEIFWYFYENESDKSTAAEVFRNIKDNSIKGNLLNMLFDRSDLGFIETIYEAVELRENLLPLIKSLVDNDHENSELVEKMLSYIASSQTSLRHFCEYLVKNRRVDNKALLNAIPLFSNRAELRRLGEALVDNLYVRDKVFDKVVQHFYGHNHAELQKLLKYVINGEQYNREEMIEQVVKLAANNQREAGKVLEELITKDLEAVRYIVYTLKAITNPEVLAKIEALIKQAGNS